MVLLLLFNRVFEQSQLKVWRNARERRKRIGFQLSNYFLFTNLLLQFPLPLRRVTMSNKTKTLHWIFSSCWFASENWKGIFNAWSNVGELEPLSALVRGNLYLVYKYQLMIKIIETMCTTVIISAGSEIASTKIFFSL